MTRALAFALAGASMCAGSLRAQGADHWPGAFAGGPGSPESLSSLACRAIADAVDLSSPTGDFDLVGLAQDIAHGRWFVSGAYGGRGAIWVFDSDLRGLPEPSTARAIACAPGAAGAWWKHRDGEWDPVGGMVYFGDEASGVYELDPVALRWTGRSWTLTGSAVPVIRALACETDRANAVLRAFVGDWTSAIEEWELDLASSAARLVATHAGNAGGLYGMTLLDGPSGVRGAFALFSQRPHSCVNGRGRISIDVFDRTSGAPLFARAADWRVPDTFFPQGGAAGGIQLASIGGQLVLACIQQGYRDVLSAVPFQGFSAFGPAECTAVLRIENAPRPGAAVSVCVAAPYAPQWAFVSLSLPPASSVPLDCGALEIGGGTTVWIELPLLAGVACFGPLVLPRGAGVLGVEVVADALLFDLAGRTSSTNRLDLLVAPRCF